MIIFTPFPNTKEVLMASRPDSYNFYEFNLSSPLAIGYNLAALIPDDAYIPKELIEGSVDTPEFDMAYGNYIMGNQEQFFTFMNVILPLYNDPCACVIVYIQHSPFRDVFLECLVKLIQQRYGYIPYIINAIEDIYEIRDNSSFSVRGIVTIQDDSDRALAAGYYGQITVPEEG